MAGEEIKAFTKVGSLFGSAFWGIPDIPRKLCDTGLLHLVFNFFYHLHRSTTSFMVNETKILGGILLLSALLVGGGVFLLGRAGNNPQTTTSSSQVQIDYSKGEKIGSDSAKVKVVEFSDLQCPACKAAESYVQELRKMDNVQLIYRHFPLPQHKFAKLTANAAQEASVQGRFWELHDRLFATQEEWSTLSDPTDFIVGLGKEVGIDEKKLRESIKEEKYLAQIQVDINEGNRLGVNSTPTFFINGKKLLLRSFADLKKAISSELNSH